MPLWQHQSDATSFLPPHPSHPSCITSITDVRQIMHSLPPPSLSASCFFVLSRASVWTIGGRAVIVRPVLVFVNLPFSVCGAAATGSLSQEPPGKRTRLFHSPLTYYANHRPASCFSTSPSFPLMQAWKIITHCKRTFLYFPDAQPPLCLSLLLVSCPVFLSSSSLPLPPCCDCTCMQPSSSAVWVTAPGRRSAPGAGFRGLLWPEGSTVTVAQPHVCA